MINAYLGALIALGIVSVLTALGITITRDNLYAAIYLAITTGLVGAIYGLFGITYGFILIYLVFVGATITITIVLAATYRRVEFRGGAGKSWVLPMILFIIAIIIASIETTYNITPITSQSLMSFVSAPSDLLLIALLSSLLMVIMIGLIMYYLEVSGRWR
jgi:NADH-quinone oxidoreductase subunit J